MSSTSLLKFPRDMELSETVNGTYNALTTTKISDGLYQVPVSTCRFFKAAMQM